MIAEPSYINAISEGDDIKHSGYSAVFGNAYNLQVVDIPFVNNASVTIYDCPWTYQLNNSMLTTIAAGRSHSGGDSGGPAVWYDFLGFPYLVGAISWSMECTNTARNGKEWVSVSANLLDPDIRDWIDTTLDNYSNTATFETLPNMTGTLEGTFSGNDFLLVGSSDIYGQCNFHNCTVYVTSNSELRLKPGSKFDFSNVVFRNCGDEKWGGITVEEGAEGSMERVVVKNAIKAIELKESRKAFLNNVTIFQCNQGVVINDDINSTKNYNLTFVKSMQSPFYASNTNLSLVGCKFSNTDITLVNCDTEIKHTEYEDGDNLRSAFYNTTTILEGGTYENTFSYFENSPFVTYANDQNLVEELNMFYCRIDDAPLELDHVESWLICKNTFENSFNDGIVVSGTTSNETKLIENNYFNHRQTDIVIKDETNIDIYCNRHNYFRELAQKTTQLKQQGGPGVPTGNIFVNRYGADEYDIVPEDKYDYYHDEGRINNYPKLETDNQGIESLEVLPTFHNPVLSDACMSSRDIISHWKEDVVDLCTPNEWLNLDCYDTCTLCVDCESLPRWNEGAAGLISGEDEVLHGFSSSGSVLIEQSSELIFFEGIEDMENMSFLVYDLSGRRISKHNVSQGNDFLSKSIFASGIYLGVLRGNDGSIEIREKIIIP